VKRRRTSGTISVLAGLLGLLAAVFIGCCSCWGVFDKLVPSSKDTPTPARSQATLRLAYSPEKEPLINELVTGFNALGLTTPDGQPMTVESWTAPGRSRPEVNRHWWGRPSVTPSRR